ncbi:MFS transporter [Pseudoclavibacter endophyticus]|uniref:MFS transporter n=1 Tax=Pseudoclavibacter endophyticus TaxID=1778590 RepID=A0A6H9WL55_9MICO|nr:MFS transporter [Pseudoclavibacter endophyticus]KAB1648242.1 MFS transporter [Pseudoclavibacter endophyticus]GGA70933.1 MFS transporter [Pseudoclavibacter endophyticus]
MPRFSPVSMGAIIGAFALVEFTSGILQGYYTPMLTDIARHLDVHDADVNWLEGSQLMLSAITVPLLSRLGDAIGHKRILLVSTFVVMVATFGLVVAPNFAVFLVAWAVQGVYTVWLPLEIALIWIRAERAAGRVPGTRPAALTRRAAGMLVAALELGVIGGALAGGALVTALPLDAVLLVPGIAVALCLIAIWVWVDETPSVTGGGVDGIGTTLLTLSLLAATGGLSLMRMLGPEHPIPWLVIAAGLLLLWPFARHELRVERPLIDVRMFVDPALWPVFVTSGLFGMSVLGAQAPLSTFARTDPAVTGYGLGISGFETSIIIGAYVLSLVAGAMLYPLVTRTITPRITLLCATLLVAIGYLLFVPFHDTYAQVLGNMLIAGAGSGALVAALPASAAAAAPADATGVATGLTNAVRMVGGAVASCVFGLALANGVAAASGATAPLGDDAVTAGSLTGYMTVWIVCGASALAAAATLLIVPKRAFVDAPEPVSPAGLVT